MLNKFCFKCGKLKLLSDFYKHPRMADGHLNKCKECAKIDVSTNYAAKREQYSRYDQKRQQDPLRRAQKQEAHARHNARNPEKYKARIAVSNAVRDGKLIKQPCRYCGSTIKVQAHHHDYSKPLDIQWECFKCHRERDHGQVVTVAT